MKFLSIVVLASLSLNAFSATTGNLYLKGIVPKKLSILITPSTGANTPTALNLEQSATNMLVAVASERSNSFSGYKVSADSLNDGKLINTTYPSVNIAYSLTYDGQVVNLSQSSVVKSKPNSVNSAESDIRISYVGVPHQNRIEGTYTDVVTFTIAAN